MLKDHYRCKEYVTSKGSTFALELVTYEGIKGHVALISTHATRKEMNAALDAAVKGATAATVASATEVKLQPAKAKTKPSKKKAT